MPQRSERPQLPTDGADSPFDNVEPPLVGKLPADDGKAYQCPEEEAPISRAIHLSRLRQGYAGCAACPQREAVGHLSAAVLPEALGPPSSPTRQSWMHAEGLRARYLNALTRPVMVRLAGMVAAMFREDLGSPRPGSFRVTGCASPPQTVSLLQSAPPPLIVVLGHDARPMSPDLAAGAARGLRRLGCHVIDVGEVTRPEMWFAVRHLEAFGGIWVNGTGTRADHCGLDVIEGSCPWSSPGRLDDLAQRLDQPLPAPVGPRATLATFQVQRPYLAGLRRHFHAFRPLRLLIVGRSGPIRLRLETLLSESPVTCDWDEPPATLRSRQETGEAEVALLDHWIADRVLQHPVDAVVRIDEDGQTCRWWDERGRAIPPVRLLRPLLGVLSRQRVAPMHKVTTSGRSPDGVISDRTGPHWLQARTALVRSQFRGHLLQDGSAPVRTGRPSGAGVREARKESTPPAPDISADAVRPVVVADAWLNGVGPLNGEVISGGTTLESMSRAMQEQSASLGLDSRGAFWFDESGPTSDALLTIARMLQWLSQTDLALSRLWADQG